MREHLTTSGRFSEAIQTAQGILANFSVHEAARVNAYLAGNSVSEATCASRHLGLDVAGRAASKAMSAKYRNPEVHFDDRDKGEIINRELKSYGFGTGDKIWSPRTWARKRKDKYGYQEE